MKKNNAHRIVHSMNHSMLKMPFSQKENPCMNVENGCFSFVWESVTYKYVFAMPSTATAQNATTGMVALSADVMMNVRIVARMGVPHLPANCFFAMFLYAALLNI